MKKIIMALLIPVFLLMLPACNTNSSEENAINDMLSGVFIIDGKEYSIDNLHEQLINNGWVADEYSEITLDAKHESVVGYQHKDYGLDILDFTISIFYKNNSDEKLGILESDITTVYIRRRGDKNPKVVFKNGINIENTMEEINSICPPTEIDKNWYIYNGIEDSNLDEVLLQFNKDNELEIIELKARV